MNTRTLCKFKGGSHSYGLNTPKSDTDWRGVFMLTDVKYLVGLGKHEHQVKQDKDTDESYKEFRHALQLLQSSNSEMVEMLFNKHWDVLTPQWERVIEERANLVDSARLFKGLRGYMQGELRLANGERTGKLGGKRKEAIDKYGFSPKNFVQLFRLAWAGAYYFQKGVFPVCVSEYDEVVHKLLMNVKTHPEFESVESLNIQAAIWERRLVESYENRKVNTKFDEKLADDLCLDVYGPDIVRAWNSRQLVARPFLKV